MKSALYLLWIIYEADEEVSFKQLIEQTQSNLLLVTCIRVRRKKIPVVPVSYREKIRVGRSEIIFFINIFFMVLAVFLLVDFQ